MKNKNNKKNKITVKRKKKRKANKQINKTNTQTQHIHKHLPNIIIISLPSIPSSSPPHAKKEDSYALSTGGRDFGRRGRRDDDAASLCSQGRPGH